MHVQCIGRNGFKITKIGTSRDHNFFGRNSTCNVFTDSAPTCLGKKTKCFRCTEETLPWEPCFSGRQYIAGWSPRAISIPRVANISPSVSELLWKHRRADFDVVKSIPGSMRRGKFKPPDMPRLKKLNIPLGELTQKKVVAKGKFPCVQ